MKLLSQFLDLLFPPKCPFCGKITDSPGICPACASSLPWVPDGDIVQALPGGVRCAAPLWYEGLAREGLLRLDGQGNLLDWDAYVQSAGLSAHVFLRDPADAPLRERVSRLLHRLAGEGIYGISRVFTAAEAKEQYQLADGFSFVLEGDGFSAFGEDWRAPFARPFAVTDYRCGHSSHGHLPEKGPQPPFLCMGPDFRPGVVLPEGRIVDEAPTLAVAMGLSLPQADGRAIAELLY